jgi:hypothetical protein
MGAVKTAPNTFMIAGFGWFVNIRVSAGSEYLCSAQRYDANYVKHYALKNPFFRAIL